MFFSLQHFISPALTYWLCLYFPILKILPACTPEVRGTRYYDLVLNEATLMTFINLIKFVPGMDFQPAAD